MNKPDVSTTVTTITHRIAQQFHPRPGSRYTILIVHDPYALAFNWFLNIKHPHQNVRSQPLAVLPRDLQLLEAVLKGVSEQYHFTINYRNCGNLRWPTTGRLIEQTGAL
ncbi:hypothetical protein [Fructilactobacillus carniphilus]|uniref:Uncharacterized protein n=1 Tax=Fructilactobacillus carniphilus TaxID=2940297 RepID=A0ABY5BXG6_9LACO|nr:hypothetical protein [Fructilactobacillus carniphilus]USS91017.1 hypothetical protein M3M37_02065 [Fructilactobacillus carniphilus]